MRLAAISFVRQSRNSKMRPTSGVNLQVRALEPERSLGGNLTQFDVERTIPSRSLGSWENSLRTELSGVSGASRRRCPDHGSWGVEAGQRALASTPGSMTENRAHVTGS